MSEKEAEFEADLTWAGARKYPVAVIYIPNHIKDRLDLKTGNRVICTIRKQT
jgi:hypothetical protein